VTEEDKTYNIPEEIIDEMASVEDKEERVRALYDLSIKIFNHFEVNQQVLYSLISIANKKKLKEPFDSEELAAVLEIIICDKDERKKTLDEATKALKKTIEEAHSQGIFNKGGKKPMPGMTAEEIFQKTMKDEFKNEPAPGQQDIGDALVALELATGITSYNMCMVNFLLARQELGFKANDSTVDKLAKELSRIVINESCRQLKKNTFHFIDLKFAKRGGSSTFDKMTGNTPEKAKAEFDQSIRRVVKRISQGVFNVEAQRQVIEGLAQAVKSEEEGDA